MSECCEPSIWKRAQEGVDASKPETRINQTFSDLLPLPSLYTRTIMSSVVAHDACVRHALLFGRQPSDFGWRSEEK